jgi:predicted nucleotidyltransferase component of viral defense system
MIPRRYIIEWKKYADWVSDYQVEQDLIISRVIAEIFSDEILSSNLAFRGGTALFKLYIKEHPRYSEDIDLVQINQEPITKIFDRLRKVLNYLGTPKTKQTVTNNTALFRFDSEYPPVINLRLKIEINTREHFNVIGLMQIPFEVKSSWYKCKCNVSTYKLEELLGTKLRALYQRSKGRDLYDIYKALTSFDLNIGDILNCYNKYMSYSVGKPPSKKNYLKNIELKMQNKEFRNDIKGLLKPSEDYNIEEAYKVSLERLFSKM